MRSFGSLIQASRGVKFFHSGSVIILAAALGGIMGMLARPAAAMPDGDKPEEHVQVKSVKGELVTVGKRAVSVEFSKTKDTSYEMLLPITADTRLERVRSLDELKPGDTVRVEYRQTYREGEKGERIVLDTVATRIALIRSAPREALTSREAPPE